MDLYVDDGQPVVTHSMLKTFRRCPKQTEFKYVHRLKPKRVNKFLRRGTWVHELLEDFHNGDDWKATHARHSAKFNEMFDEEKDYYGDMPAEILAVMKSYIWHYKADPWKVLETEFLVEAMLPNGVLYRGKVDALVETPFGRFLVDHKTHKTLPNHDFRLKDGQSALYLWAARESGLGVQGFIWNYLRWKAPSVPEVVYQGKRLSSRACDTDYPTMYRAVKRYQEEYPDRFELRPEDAERLKYLKSLRYEWGKPQASTFFRRDVLEKDDAMLDRVMRENLHTAKRMAKYKFDDPDSVERVVDRSCTFSCSYEDICTVELMGGNMRPLVKQNYQVGDPQEYYQDRTIEENRAQD